MLKKKITAFKPKARPRPNANPTQTLSSSAQPSVERQTQTPTTLPRESQSTGPNTERQPETATIEDTPPTSDPSQTHPPTRDTTREKQPTSQPLTTPANQESTSEPSVIPVPRESPAKPVARNPVPRNATEATVPTASEPSTGKTGPTPENTPSVPNPTELSSTIGTTPIVTATTSKTTSTRTALPSSRPDASDRPTAVEIGSGMESQDVATASPSANTTSTRPSQSRRPTGSGEGRPAKRRRVAGNSHEDIRPTIEDDTSQPETSAKSKRRRKPRDPNAPKRKRKKASTPEDAETQVVDKATTKMSDLTKDLHIGRNFSMRDTILQRELERKEKIRIEREKELHENSDVSDGEGGSGQNGEEAGNGENRPPADDPATNNSTPNVPVTSSSVPQLRVLNGVIVLDESSLQVDRHRVAAEGAGEMDVVEEDDFTRIVTSATNQKRERNTRWGHHETEKFYEGLQMFGTDFGMIAKTFGKKRSRRQIKLKYNKEEIENPDRIHRCITGKDKQAMDLSKLKEASKYTDTDDIKAEIAALEKNWNDKESRQAEELAEADRRKRDAITTGGRPGGGAGGRESSKENEATSGKASAAPRAQKKAPAKKNKRALIQHMGGEETEIVGTIDDY